MESSSIRPTRSSQRLSEAIANSRPPEMSFIKSEPEEDSQSDYLYHESIDLEDDTSDGVEMFVNVDVKVDTNSDVDFESEPSNLEGENLENDWNIMDSHVSSEGQSRGRGIVAKLAQKLNSKLKSVTSPRPTDSLLACLEPEVSVATSGLIASGGVYVCPWCPLISLNPESLEKHKKLRHPVSTEEASPAGDPPERVHSCDECGKTFAKSWHLKRHYIIHSGERPFICVDCGETFVTGGDLTTHQKMHEGVSVEVSPTFFPGTSNDCWLCIYCDEEFPTRESLKAHSCAYINTQNNVDTKVYYCRWMCFSCDKGFASKDHLIAHQDTHSFFNPDVKGYCCQQCGRNFKLKDKFSQHMRAHKSDHYLCALCDKSFLSNECLKSHLHVQHKVETGDEDIFKCEECEKEFNDVIILKRHLQMHSWAKPYSCDTCGDSFRGDNDLKVHMRKHTGERPYICPVCGEGFTKECNLTMHIRIHEGGGYLECRVCGCGFHKTSTLNEHMKIHKKLKRERSDSEDDDDLEVVTSKPAVKKPCLETNVKSSEESSVPQATDISSSFKAALAQKLKKHFISHPNTIVVEDEIPTKVVPDVAQDPQAFRQALADKLMETGFVQAKTSFCSSEVQTISENKGSREQLNKEPAREELADTSSSFKAAIAQKLMPHITNHQGGLIKGGETSSKNLSGISEDSQKFRQAIAGKLIKTGFVNLEVKSDDAGQESSKDGTVNAESTVQAMTDVSNTFKADLARKLRSHFMELQDLQVNDVKHPLKSDDEMGKDSKTFRQTIAAKLINTGFVSSQKEEANNFRDTIAERLKKTGVLSFGNGNVSLRLL